MHQILLTWQIILFVWVFRNPCRILQEHQIMQSLKHNHTRWLQGLQQPIKQNFLKNAYKHYKMLPQLEEFWHWRLHTIFIALHLYYNNILHSYIEHHLRLRFRQQYYMMNPIRRFKALPTAQPLPLYLHIWLKSSISMKIIVLARSSLGIPVKV